MSNWNVQLPPATPTGNAGTYRDLRADVADMTRQRPVDAAFAAAFLHSKSHIIKTHPAFSPERRKLVMSDFLSRVGRVTPDLIHQPAPGGVGYGTFYKPDFKTAFATGTEIIWGAICPAQPGGNVNTFLYVTATNRSSSGVEALIVYDGTGQVSFQVYDWAKPDDQRWKVNIPFGSLTQYIQAQTYQGQNYPVLPIWNSTVRTTPSNWQNSVYLYDRTSSQWALVYQYDYAAPDASQKNGWVGSWGPIVETFQDLYHGTNPLGAVNVQLRALDDNGTWSQWNSLADSEADLRTDNVGFHQTYLEPDYDWVVTS